MARRRSPASGAGLWTWIFRGWAILCAGVAIFLGAAALADFLYWKLFHKKQARVAGVEAIEEYRDKPWLRQFVVESERTHHRNAKFAPFVGWRRPPYAGSTITVDAAGRRGTAGANCAQGSYRLFVYGGSAAWGTGSPDWETLPAHLQRMLSDRFDGRLCVVSLGETSWNSNQELIQLVLNLKEGEVPDLALFYDGWNDVTSGYKNRTVEGVDRTDLLNANFEQAAAPPIDLLRLVAPHIWTALSPSSFLWMLREAEPGLGERILDNYERNMRMARKLARAYGFKVHHFWQPSLIIGEHKLTPGEAELISDFERPAFGTFARALKPRFKDRYPDFDDISDVFDSEPGRVWVDDRHVTPRGNALIATRIIEILDRRKVLAAPRIPRSG